MGIRDRIDQKIVEALAENAWLTFEALGEIACLSPSATQRRVQRLRREGVIKGARAIIDDKDRNEPQRIFALITLASDSRRNVDQTRTVLQRGPGFVSACLVTGSTDIIAIYDAPSVETFTSWAMADCYDHSNITHFTTNISLANLAG